MLKTALAIVDDNQALKVGVKVVLVLACGLFFAATISLGIYGYNNPDPKACWVVSDLDTGYKTKTEAEEQAII